MKEVVSAFTESLTKILKSKTFALLFLAFLVACVALFIGKLTGEMWKDLVEWIIGGGAVRGTVEHVQTKVKSAESQIKSDVAGKSDDALAADAAKLIGSK